MKLGIIRLYIGESGKVGYYNIQEIGLAKSLAKRGVTTDIFFLVDKKKSKEVKINTINEKVRVIYLPANKFLNHGIINPKFIEEYGIEIVHLLSDNQIIVPSFIKYCKRKDIPLYNYLGTISSDSNNRFKRFFMSIISQINIKYYKNSKVIVKTNQLKNQLLQKGLESSEVIPVGLDLEIIPKINKSRNELRIELNLPLDKFILIFVGRLEAYKHPLDALELIQYLNKNEDRYRLIIIGDGCLKNKVKQKINESNLVNSVILVNKVPNSEIHRYYKASDMFINFNKNEIFGMSILEAMNQGCKVCAISAPGPNYIINNNVDGLLLDEFNVKKWGDMINNNITNRDLSINAAKKIESSFSWDTIVEKYLRLYKEIYGE